MTNPTMVVVPGAWQKPSVFENLCQKLREAGYPTEQIILPSVGGHDLPLAGLAEDVAAVQSVLNQLTRDGKRAVLLGHSSGGLIASNAAEGFDVDGIIYMTAFVVPKGKALMELMGGKPLHWMDVQGDRVFGKPELLPEVAFNDLDAEAQAKWAKEMTHQSAALYMSPSNYEPWTSGLPCGYIFCTDDNAVPLPLQQQMAALLAPGPAVATLKAGHCPHLSMPDDVVQAVQDVHSKLSRH
ncbi:hypothetical protein PFICI_14337 [Pestalotiopsis fici W106-1]|uniref:AB hydrolase-1 domain-containing protein n=1 Tax=Pestalotiopsis fici (strain W106-1 / CGMCC3.15140) TaxID=1229662 RepID=W3WNS0_PESFW|nr:uncharacterized protein PFICI_14337 [Pestalotiopsis fici W106-1]ETS74471.1 hypothetical protein PFICI_14337 [Pestalotiopsis fici W106-1]